MLVSVTGTVSLVYVRIDVNAELDIELEIAGGDRIDAVGVHPRGYRYRCRWPWRTRLRRGGEETFYTPVRLSGN